MHQYSCTNKHITAKHPFPRSKLVYIVTKFSIIFNAAEKHNHAIIKSSIMTNDMSFLVSNISVGLRVTRCLNKIGTQCYIIQLCSLCLYKYYIYWRYFWIYTAFCSCDQWWHYCNVRHRKYNDCWLNAMWSDSDTDVLLVTNTAQPGSDWFERY